MTYLGTFELPAKKLTTYPGNPRRGDVDTIRESLRTHGQYRAIVARAHNPHDPAAGGTVLAGNHTLQALIAEHAELHAEDPNELDSIRAGNEPGALAAVRVEMHDVDDVTAAKIVAVDNRSADKGDYDDRALAELLNSVGDLTGTGYDTDDLDDLAARLDPAPGSAELLKDPGEDNYTEQWGVVITCENAEHQQQVYERMTEEGYNARVVTV